MKPSCSHPALNDQLLLYVEDALAAADRKALEHHVQECPLCTRELRELQEILQTVKTHSTALAPAPSSATCPAPELLVAYAERRETLPAADAAALATHLAACTECTREYEYVTLLQQEPVQQPDFIEMTHREKEFLAMASQQVPAVTHAASGFWHRMLTVINSLKNKVQDLATDLSIAEPQPVFVRKAPRRAGENISVVSDASRGIALRIEIEAVSPDTVELVVFSAMPNNKKLPAGMRVSLFHEGIEQASFIISRGTAVFRKLPHATYELSLSREGKEIKRIQFTTR